MRKWPRTILAVAGLVGLAIAALYGLDYYRKATQGPSKDSCIANLIQLDGAKDTWALEHHKSTNDMVTWGDLVGAERYIRNMPICPHGGTYTVGTVGEKPSCSCGRSL